MAAPPGGEAEPGDGVHGGETGAVEPADVTDDDGGRGGGEQLAEPSDVVGRGRAAEA